MEPLMQELAHEEHEREAVYAMGGMTGLLVVLIIGVFSFSVVDHFVLNNSSLASVISAVLVDLTNGDRASNSIGGLTVNPVLTAAAQAKADDMAAKGYFAHVSPEGKNSWVWFQEAGYKFSYAGENLAVDFSDSADVERAWMNSPTHRANVLNEHFTEIGIAVARGTYQGRSTTFVAQMFGTPAATPVQTRVITLASPAEPSEPALATVQGATTKPTPATTTPVPPSQVAGSVTTATASKTAPFTATATLVLGTEAEGLSAPIQPSAAWWEHIVASPKTLLRYAYIGLAGLVLVLLVYVTELEFHKRHLHHVAAALGLLVLMIGLFTLADLFLFVEPVIAALPG